MYVFTDTLELRKFEREMKQKPNFDRRDDGYENKGVHFSEIRKTETERKNQESHSNAMPAVREYAYQQHKQVQ